jgi:hypothetical protein
MSILEKLGKLYPNYRIESILQVTDVEEIFFAILTPRKNLSIGETENMSEKSAIGIGEYVFVDFAGGRSRPDAFLTCYVPSLLTILKGVPKEVVEKIKDGKSFTIPAPRQNGINYVIRNPKGEVIEGNFWRDFKLVVGNPDARWGKLAEREKRQKIKEGEYIFYKKESKGKNTLLRLTTKDYENGNKGISIRISKGKVKPDINVWEISPLTNYFDNTVKKGLSNLEEAIIWIKKRFPNCKIKGL